jgi:hypothetical protein
MATMVIVPDEGAVSVGAHGREGVVIDERAPQPVSPEKRPESEPAVV